MSKTTDTQALKILNDVRTVSSYDYREKVSTVRLEKGKLNLQIYGNEILTSQNLQNEFVTNLINRIGLTMVSINSFNNPLAILKKSDRLNSVFGGMTQEIYTNPATAHQYDVSDTSRLLNTTSKPDTKVLYHEENRREYFELFVGGDLIRKAFTNSESFMEYVNSIISSLENGNYIREFEYTKTLFSTAVEKNYIKKISVDSPSTTALTDKFLITLKKVIKDFKFASTKWNSYDTFNGEKVVSMALPSDVIIAIRADIMSEIEVNALAKAFNVSYMTMENQILEVDEFPNYPNLLAVAFDKRYIVIEDSKMESRSFSNGATLTETYWLHVWQTYSVSTFHNSVAFFGSGAIDGLTILPTNASVVKGGTETFTATATGNATDKTINYSIAGQTSELTTIDVEGLLTVGEDETAEKITVIAKPNADMTKSVIANVAITDVIGE